MRLHFRAIAALLACMMFVPASFAEESAAEAHPIPTATPPASHAREDLKVRTFYMERWENAFDLRTVKIGGKNHYMIGAQWNRKFSFGTMLGLGGIGTPMNATVRKDGQKDSYSFYAAGMFIGHQIFDFNPFRLIAFVNGGKGMVFHRSQAEGEESTFGSAKFTYLDPGIYLTFYSRDTVDVGVSFSGFAAKFDKKDDPHAKASDLGGATAGLTFRTLYH